MREAFQTGDKVKAVQDITNFLSNSGISNAAILSKAFVEPLLDLKSKVIQNPSEAEKVLVLQALDDFQKSNANVFLALPGLQEAIKDPVLLLNPKIAAVVGILTAQAATFAYIRQNPEAAYNFLNDPVRPLLFSQILGTFVEAFKQIEAINASTTATSTAATLPPLTETQKAVSEKLSSLFTGNDVANSQSSLTSLLNSIGINTAELDKTFTAVSALSAVLTDNPTLEQKTQISAKLGELGNIATAFFLTQPGLNIDINSDVFKDPENQEFLAFANQLTAQFNGLIEDPTNALTMFSTKIPELYARYYTMLAELSARTVAKNGT